MKHDESYRLLFSNPEMVADLLRGYVSDEINRDLDWRGYSVPLFSSANGAPYHSPRLADRAEGSAALNLKPQGFSTEQIAKLTGLPAEDIEGLFKANLP